jgi:hypothetical protein
MNAKSNAPEKGLAVHLKVPTQIFNRYLDRFSSVAGGLEIHVDRANRELRVSKHGAAEVVCIPYEAVVSFTVAAATTNKEKE